VNQRIILTHIPFFLANMASISHRYSIRWLPKVASEPTSTLVLTSKSGFYIDIRIKHDKAKDPPSSLPVSEDTLLHPTGERQTKWHEWYNGNDYTYSTSDPMDKLDLDWAFAGNSKSVHGSNGKPRQCTWEHWVDSRTNILGENPIKDSGSMYPQKDGKCLEKGSMVDPATGKETEYEEIWEDLDLTYPAGLKHKYYVLTLDHEDKDGFHVSRGVTMQLGCWFQSMLRNENDEAANEVGAARWKWDESEGNWDLVARAGDKIRLPAPYDVEEVLSMPGDRVGQKVQIFGKAWTCRELGQ
jgi:hypothetical protein